MIADFSLSGGVALVTGAGSGIGRAIALGLAEAGALVGCVDQVPGNVVATAAVILAAGSRAVPVVADVTDPAAMPAAVADHCLSLGLARQEDAGEVDVDDPPPLLFRHGLGGSRVGDAGRVNPERQRPERRLDVRQSRGQGGRIGHVCGNRDCPAACGEDLGGGGLDVPGDLIDAADQRARLSEP